MYYRPGVGDRYPLLVALHTWSGDYGQAAGTPYAEWCIREQWAMIHPDFRGANGRPESTGSDAVLADIRDAVMFAESMGGIDVSRIYLIGASGGAYTGLLAAARMPELWAGVSLWAPITDLTLWYKECLRPYPNYSKDIEKACGGPPVRDTPAFDECMRRSPISYLRDMPPFAMDINAGIRDGHSGSVPIGHALLAFNASVPQRCGIVLQELDSAISKAAVPEVLKFIGVDPAYGNKQPLFRRQCNNVRITLFDGGHEIVFDAGLRWLSQQRKH
jgi:pimeloyl-ACP methyl ester carboxylesterase